MEQLDNFYEQWTSPQPFIDAHTSGSTGTPKAIRLLKADMRASARATNAFFSINRNSLLASPLSIDYIAGKMMSVRALEAGCRFVQLPVCSSINLDSVDGHIDLLPVVPPQIDSLLTHPEYAAKAVNILIGGAAPMPDQCRALVQAGYNAYISYGMTETCSHVALARADDPERIYTAMPGISFETDDKGRLRIIAPHYSFGVLNTTDIAELLSPQTFRWLGRADSVINSGGIKMYAEELERLYAPALEGRSYFVRGDNDSRWGQAVTLVFEGRAEEEAGIAKAVNAIVPDHRQRPKRIVAITAIERTPNGKIKRR